MPECLLVIAGKALDVESLMNGHDLKPCFTWKRGEARVGRPGDVNLDNGVKFAVSSAGDVRDQIADATAFLASHCALLESMLRTSSVDAAVLDFGWCFDSDKMAAQFGTLPLGLLRHCTTIGLDICVSVYATSPTPPTASDEVEL